MCCRRSSSCALVQGSVVAATYHIGGFLISIVEIGCVVGRFSMVVVDGLDWCSSCVKPSLCGGQTDSGKFVVATGLCFLPRFSPLWKRMDLAASGYQARSLSAKFPCAPPLQRSPSRDTRCPSRARPASQSQPASPRDSVALYLLPTFALIIVYDAPLKEQLPARNHGLQQEG